MAKGDDLQRVSRAVAARRGQLGMTQQDLADAAGIDLKTVYNLESGARWPIARTRVAISGALGWKEDGLAALAAGGLPVETESVHLRPAPAPPPPADIEDVPSPLLRQLPRAMAKQIQPGYDAIMGALRDWTSTGEPPRNGPVPLGEQVFRTDPARAALWDDLAAQLRDLGIFADDASLSYHVAETMATALWHSRRQGDQASGTAGLQVPRPRRPVIHALRFRER